MVSSNAAGAVRRRAVPTRRCVGASARHYRAYHLQAGGWAAGVGGIGLQRASRPGRSPFGRHGYAAARLAARYTKKAARPAVSGAWRAAAAS